MLQLIWDGARKEIEKMYEDTCSIFSYVPNKDDDTCITEMTETVLHEAVPCRLSFMSSPSISGDMAPEIRQSVKLFLSPEIEIPPGCRIDVTHCGKTVRYNASGVPALHPTHQEIALSIYEKTP